MTYVLEVEESEEDATILQFNLTPVYRAHYINTCLGLQVGEAGGVEVQELSSMKEVVAKEPF